MIKTNFEGVGRALNRISAKMAKMEDIATTRALNEILMKQRAEIANDVFDEYGVLKGSAKKHIKPVKATRLNKEIKLIASSTRSNLVGARQIKSGISFIKKGGSRTKIKVAVKTGSSKPFMIKAKSGTSSNDIKVKGGVKKVPVYVSRRFNKFTNILQRKVTTMKGSSIAHMVESLAIDSKNLAKAIRTKFPAIYKKQLKKASFTGSK